MHWIQARVREPSATWNPRTRVASSLPIPVNLPGMDWAAAAVVARYGFMPVEWRADVIQDFMACWLLRPGSAETLARSALAGVARGAVPHVAAGIAWKLRMEILSRASRALKKARRRQELDRVAIPAYEWVAAEKASAA